MIDAYATAGSYWRHLSPIVDELRARGHEVRVWTAQKARPWGSPIRRRREAAPVALCASWVDADALRPQRCVYVEHGAGQRYVGTDGRGYAGADGLDHVVLFLGPGEHVSERWRARYPQAAVESVGCPALDRHLPAQRHGHRPMVAISSHWRCFRVPETVPALPYFETGLVALAQCSEVELLGHAHPRANLRGGQRWERLGVPFDPDPDSVLARADLLVCDSSSLMYEAAALNVPVLALNSPRWRRDVEHGLRFWSHVPGIQCDHVSTFLPALMAALDDPPEARALRRRAAERVYAVRDGSSTRRAVDAIESCL